LSRSNCWTGVAAAARKVAWGAGGSHADACGVAVRARLAGRDVRRQPWRNRRPQTAIAEGAADADASRERSPISLRGGRHLTDDRRSRDARPSRAPHQGDLPRQRGGVRARDGAPHL